MIEKLKKMIFGKPAEPPPECEVMCPRHHYALEACGKCVEDTAYRAKNALFLRALFIIGLCSLLSIMYNFMVPAVEAYKNIQTVRFEYAQALENYTCTLNINKVLNQRGCVCSGYWYQDCNTSMCRKIEGINVSLS